MFALYMLVLTMTLAQSQPLDTIPETGYRILVPGSYHSDEIPPFTDSGWYGLFKVGSTYRLDSVSIRKELVFDPIVDGGSADTTGIEVSADSDSQPVFMVQSRRKLSTGSIERAPIVKARFSIEYPLVLSEYWLYMLGEVTDEGHGPGNLMVLDYRLVICLESNRNEQQTLVEYRRMGFDEMPSLLWAGDLDGDGKTDLFLDLTNHYNVTHYALYLSSEAAEDEILKLVATLRSVGC